MAAGRRAQTAAQSGAPVKSSSGDRRHAEQRARAGALRLEAPGRALVEPAEHEHGGVGLGQHLGQRGVAELGGVGLAHRPRRAEVAQEVALAVVARLAAQRSTG